MERERSSETTFGREGDRERGWVLRSLTEQEALPTHARAGEITRSRLLEQFRSQQYPIVLLSAPAGSGKSILAAQACNQDERRAAWCVLRESDNDPVALVSHLARAFRAIGPVDHEYLRACLDPNARSAAALLPGLADAMASCSPFILVLDDLHLVSSEGSAAVIRDVVRVMPADSQLILASRSDPDIGLARLRAAQYVVEYRAPDLALDRAEISTFLDAAEVTHDDAAVSQLEATTEGWAAGIALATLSLGSTHLTADAVRRFGTGHHDIVDYLITEVLARQDPVVRTFLLETSIVGRLSGALCDFVCDRADSGQLLRQLERTNLFLTPIDDAHEWYRYHHLFQTALRAELNRTQPRRARELLQRSAIWHEREGDPEEAFEYAHAAGDVALMGRVALRHWEQYVDHGRLQTLQRWLLACSDEEIESDTPLSIAATWVFLLLGDPARTNRYLAAAEHAADLDEPSPDGATTRRSALLNVRSAVAPRGAIGMLEDGRSVYDWEGPNQTRWMLGACRAIGVASVLLGQTDEAIAALEEAKALSHDREEVGFARVMCLGYLALAHADRQEWFRAEETIDECMELIERLGMEDNPLALPMYAAHLSVLGRQEREEDAREVALTLSRNLPMLVAAPWLVADIASRSAQSLLLIGDHEGARRFTEAAESSLRGIPDPGIVAGRVEALHARIADRHTQLSSLTPAERRVLHQLATHRTLGEIATELQVRRATVKNQVASIYQKLGVSSRSDAVAVLDEHA